MGNHPLLDNVLWEAFSHGQPQFTVGFGGIRRYAPGFSSIVAFENPNEPDLESLLHVSEIGDTFYCDQWEGTPPDQWTVEAETTMFKMVYQGEIPEVGFARDVTRLESAHAHQALDLAELTNPGPFGIRNLELGVYYGIFDHGKLVSMAGERMFAGPYREVSGVCTHPDYLGQGYAKRLMLHVMCGAMLRGEIPFLHVLSHNEVARSLYRRMGYQDYLETTVRVIRRQS